jgi:hypothetical protein
MSSLSLGTRRRRRRRKCLGALRLQHLHHGALDGP